MPSLVKFGVNTVSNDENRSEEETDDAMLLPLSDAELIDLTLWWCNSWSCEIDLDIKWGEWPTSEFCICCTKGDVASTLKFSKLQSLIWLIDTYISTKDTITKCNDTTNAKWYVNHTTSKINQETNFMKLQELDVF